MNAMLTVNGINRPFDTWEELNMVVSTLIETNRALGPEQFDIQLGGGKSISDTARSAI